MEDTLLQIHSTALNGTLFEGEGIIWTKPRLLRESIYEFRAVVQWLAPVLRIREVPRMIVGILMFLFPRLFQKAEIAI